MKKFVDYQLVKQPIPKKNLLWPLYGAGFENLGLEGQLIETNVPTPGENELLVRHDACGLCFSDIKVIKAGQTHPRIYREMSDNPVVLGHEISMTVVKVGHGLQDQYQVGDRFTIQADVFVGGIGYAYGYEIQGGLSQYNIIDDRILHGDDGNYLLPVKMETGYAESALTEPWACVIAAYQLEYRQKIKSQGTTWFIGTDDTRPYYISDGFDASSHPARVILTYVSNPLGEWIRSQCQELDIELIEIDDIDRIGEDNPLLEQIDDIIILGNDVDLIEKVSPYLAEFGVCAILSDKPQPRKVSVDIGRIHYNRWVYVGTKSEDISQAYKQTPVRSTLKPGGSAWFVGAGGPMGRMHVQRAIQIAESPSVIVCSDVSDLRLSDLCVSFAEEAKEKGIEFICVNPFNKEEYQAVLNRFQNSGFDDIIVLAPVIPVINEAYIYLAPKGVMNVFAGLSRGSMISVDIGDAYLRDTRLIGHSASTIEDLKLMLHQAETNELSPNRSVAAIGSLGAAREGLKAVEATTFPGKVVIYPQIKDLPLTALIDLDKVLPEVYSKLKDGREWTNEAEIAFFEAMLP